MMELPKYFCWSRFGTEAGQGIEDILERKEQERIANGGMFLWGIGNAIGPSMAELVRRTRSPEVVFSPIKSPPRKEDCVPRGLAVWTAAESLEGIPFPLPEHSLVTSRYDPGVPKKTHYALVCYSGASLKIVREQEKIAVGSLVNILTARSIGASQVTAIVQRIAVGIEKGPIYDVSFRMRLLHPFFLRLTKPLVLTKTESVQDWSTLVQRIWKKKRGSSPSSQQKQLLQNKGRALFRENGFLIEKSKNSGIITESFEK